MMPASFNSQPPEGGWDVFIRPDQLGTEVSTHSRPKAAGFVEAADRPNYTVSTHSRPKAAGPMT